VAILSRGYGEIPDEALLLAKRLPQVKVYIGKNRVDLAEKAVNEGAELLILDDGFQYRKLHRDFDLVLTTGKKEHYLPWGRLRDSPSRLKKAQIISLKLVLRRIVDSFGRELKSMEGQKAAYFCGIARPERFKKTLLDLKVQISKECLLADHEPVKLADLQNLAAAAPLILTTEKDFVKLPKHSLPIYYLEMGAQITSDLDEWETLIEKIDQKIDNKPTYE
jgi:tetraacyldisaccharide 4'-kinase